MQAQEIFDTVATHLFKQGRRATNWEMPHMCSYRGAGGSKCAVGVLIPDDVYDPMMEGRTIIGLVDSGSGLPDWMSENKTLLSWLQDVHDVESNWKSSDTMKAALRQAAGANSVKADVLNGLSFAWETKAEEV